MTLRVHYSCMSGGSAYWSKCHFDEKMGLRVEVS